MGWHRRALHFVTEQRVQSASAPAAAGSPGENFSSCRHEVHIRCDRDGC